MLLHTIVDTVHVMDACFEERLYSTLTSCGIDKLKEKQMEAVVSHIYWTFSSGCLSSCLPITCLINALSCVSLACLLVVELHTHTNLDKNTQENTANLNKQQSTANLNKQNWNLSTWKHVVYRGHGRRDDKIAKMAPKKWAGKVFRSFLLWNASAIQAQRHRLE